MDLFEFDDLPEPSTQTEAPKDKKNIPPTDVKRQISTGSEASAGLFDDLPSTAQEESQLTNTGPSLFDGLPIAKDAKRTEKLPRNGETLTNTGGMKRKLESTEKIPEKMIKSDLQGQFLLCGYSASKRGEREEMQDTHVIINDLLKQSIITASNILRQAYYAVFDGHAGDRASKFLEQNMHKYLIERLQKCDPCQVEKEMKRTLIDTYRKTDEAFLKDATKQKPAWKDGSTATTVLVVNDTVFVSNVGDSKAILCRENNEGQQVALTLTKDHNPEVYEERMRIQKAGGVVRDGRVMGVLEVSRSIGDGQFKKQGVTCIPDIRRCQLTDKDKFLLIACDGLWKTLSPEEVIKIVQEVQQNTCVEASENVEDVRWETACNKLVNEAIRRLSGDNVTVIIISIKPK